MDTAPTREWYPVDLIDEFTPDGRASPEAWLAFLDPNKQGLLDEDDEWLAEHYAPGLPIKFQWVEPRGTMRITVNPDGTSAAALRCCQTPDLFTGEVWAEPGSPSSDVNHFWEPESEVLATTLAEFALLYAEQLGPLDEPESVQVIMSRWSDTLTYRISDDGKSLTPLPSPQEKPDV